MLMTYKNIVSLIKKNSAAKKQYDFKNIWSTDGGLIANADGANDSLLFEIFENVEKMKMNVFVFSFNFFSFRVF